MKLVWQAGVEEQEDGKKGMRWMCDEHTLISLERNSSPGPQSNCVHGFLLHLQLIPFQQEIETKLDAKLLERSVWTE